jgi:hypothetical protein
MYLVRGVLALGFILQTATGESASTKAIAVRLIVVDSAGEAEKILDRLKAGDDFAVLAREKSVDATAIDGGLLGEVDPATLRPELRDALQGVEPGHFSKIAKIPLGYAILEVLRPNELSGRESAARARQAAVTAAASVRYAPDVSGLVDTENVLLQFPKPEGWEQNLQATCEVRRRSIEGAMKDVATFVTPAKQQSLLHNKNVKPIDMMQAYASAAQFYAYQGQMAEAITQWEKASRIAAEYIPQAVPAATEALGIAYLHKADMDNAVFRHPGERCLFPMPSSARYTQTASSEKAVQYFLRYLSQQPGDLEVKWLLNIALMTLGRYPGGVPREYLLPPSAFDSPEDIGRFEDVAPQVGLGNFEMAGGVIVDDFDNDGLLDVMISSFNNCVPLRFFHNNGNGTFTDRAKEAGLLDQLGGLNVIQADYNNDGCMDFLVLRGGWEFAHRRSLLRNNCDGTFTDVTKEAGLAIPATASQTAVWADINNDGLLDLFVGNEKGPAQLFLNKGDGTFQDISHAAGIDRTAYTKAVVAADYDNDGYVDFYVSNFTSLNFLYHNNHDGTFTEIAEQAGVQGTGRSFGAWFFDYDNDGRPDLFVTSYYMSIDETARTYLGLPHNAGTLKLYKNLGNGVFRDVTEETKLDRVFMPMGANFGDVDNDGYLDIYLGTGNPSYGSVIPNVLLRNHDGKFFVDITASSGTGDLHKGHGVAFADIDNDGDEDLFAEIGGATPGDSHAFRLFENPGNGNDWISLRLVGVKANRSAIGARIKLTVKNEGAGVRSIYRTVGSGGSFGASPLEQHIGLGKSAEILGIEIVWPGGGGAAQTFSHVDKNQAIEVKEFAREFTKIVRRPYRLGGAKAAAVAAGVQR